MRIVVTADVHAHNFNDFSYITESGRTNRLEATLSALSEMRKHCVEVDADLFVIVGDIYESQDKIAIDVLDGISSELQAFDDEDIPVLLILGNHDYAIKSAKYHSLRPFRSFAYIVDTPDVYLEGESDCVLFCVPFIENRLKLVSHLNSLSKRAKSLPDTTHKLFLGHLGVSDAFVGATERRIKSPISSSKLHPDAYDLCLLGHYHKPQQIGDNVFYIGSPLQNDWGEREDEKVFFDIDTSDGFKYEVIPVDGPKFRLLTVEEFEKLEDKTKDFIKIQPKNQEELDKLQRKDIGKTVQVLPLENQETEEEAPKLKIAPGQSMERNINDYVGSFDFESGDEKELINLGLDILSSVQ